MSQEDFCEKLLGRLVIFKLYLLRTRRREQHRNGNKNMCPPLGRKETLPFSQEEKDLMTFFFLAYELLPLVDFSARDEKGRYGANAGRGLHSFL